MKILLTGATGYIGQRLLPALVDAGHSVVCCVRDKKRFHYDAEWEGRITVIEVDFLQQESLQAIPHDIDAAYYLIHSMTTSSESFTELERQSAQHFVKRIEETNAQQIVFLSGIINDSHLSTHLQSRKNVEETLAASKVPLTTLRAGIIIGSGGASFEIIRDLVEKLPIMVAPKWLATRCQPISIVNVIEYLAGVLLVPQAYGHSFDIGGPDVLTFKEMLLQFAEVRKLTRYIFLVPVMSPNISSYWLYFITSTNFNLAKNLVKSMHVEVVCKPSAINTIVPVSLISYKDAVAQAFDKIEQNQVVSSWTDALTSSTLRKGISAHILPPYMGCFRDIQRVTLTNPERALDNIFSIGGKRGWYYANWLWSIRGLIDKCFGGIGLNRGRKNSDVIEAGQTLDFWRVLVADKEQKRLLLYAEMKLPGEAWLEFAVRGNELVQTATFRPLGVLGRLYWYCSLPFHIFIFRGMAHNIATKEPEQPVQ